jgi:Flp pilus assembly protein TadG
VRRAPLQVEAPAVIDARSRREGGQGLVELAMLVPVFLLILLGMLEFGFAFNHNLTLEAATREGARAGAAMADGSQEDTTCGSSTLTAANVDPLIIAAVQRVLESPGSMIDRAQIQNITIYKVSNDGSTIGPSNVWTYRAANAANPAVPCLSTTQHLDFYESSHAWDVAGRNNGVTPDSVGVSITYTYQFRSALGGILRFFGGSNWSQITMTDKSVMALEPTS